MSHPEIITNLGDTITSGAFPLFSFSENWSANEWLSQILILNARAFILLFICTIIIRCIKGSAANRHFFFFSALCAVTLLPIVTQLIPTIAVELEVIRASLPVLPETVKNYIAPLHLKAIDFEKINSNTSSTLFVWFQFLLAIYCLTTSLLVTKILWGNFLVFIITKFSIPIETGSWSSIIERERLHLNLDKPVILLASKHIASPITWGCRKPVIILPYYSIRWEEQVIRSTVLHELAHIKRRDWLAQQICRLICACFWINPMCWYALKKLCAYAEVACDDIALKAGIKNSHYANDLVSIAKHASKEVFDLASIAMATPDKRGELTQRVEAILEKDLARHSNSSHQVLLTWAVVSGLLLPFSSLNAHFIQIIETATVSLPQTNSNVDTENPLHQEFDSTMLVNAAIIQPPAVQRLEVPLDLEGIRNAVTRGIQKRLELLKPEQPSEILAADKKIIKAQNKANTPNIKAIPKSSSQALAQVASKPIEIDNIGTIDTKTSNFNVAPTENSSDDSDIEIYSHWADRNTYNPSLIPGYVKYIPDASQRNVDIAVVENYSRKNLVVPRYPKKAEQRGIEGEVVVEFSIDAQGRVINPTIVTAQPNQIFNRHVLRAIKKSTFIPHRVDGIAVAVEKAQEIFVFKIEA